MTGAPAANAMADTKLAPCGKRSCKTVMGGMVRIEVVAAVAPEAPASVATKAAATVALVLAISRTPPFAIVNAVDPAGDVVVTIETAVPVR